jgi:hypothetical protein
MRNTVMVSFVQVKQWQAMAYALGVPDGNSSLASRVWPVPPVNSVLIVRVFKSGVFQARDIEYESLSKKHILRE